jgi:Arc/MetJ-type ribon-helix-helix transcriptional regulator
MEKQTHDAVVAARVPLRLKKLVEEFIKRDAHLNESDLVRDALREKIKREAPELYQQLFLKEVKSDDAKDGH